MVGVTKKYILETKTLYENSTIVNKYLQKSLSFPLRLAFFDIDFTLSSDTTLLPTIRKSLEKRGYATVFVTARTEEMVMSRKTYEKSIHAGFYRPRPYMLKKNERYEYIDPKKINKFLVDPDIIVGSTGTQILVKQASGVYKKDTEFENRLTADAKGWRRKVMQLLGEIDPMQKHFSFAPIEDVTNYYMGTTNVFPPKLRIQLFFSSFDEKKWFLKELKQRNVLHTLTQRSLASFFRVTEETKEKNGMFSLYLTPVKGHKGYAVEYVVKQLLKAVKAKNRTITKSNIETILAGDSHADLGMLLHGALGTKSTAILVGGSEVGKMLTMSGTTGSMTEDVLSLRTKLVPSSKKGHFTYQVPTDVSEEKISRTLIIGDSAYPQTIGSQTILAHLSAHTPRTGRQSILFSRLHKAVSSIRIYLPVPALDW